MTRTVRPSVQAACSSPSTNCTCSVSLLLQNGEWNGKQLIPAEWVKEATSKQVENGSEGYGYLFWAGPEGSFRADGKYGQFVILMRDKNAVITVTAESRDAGALLRAVFEEIYPQL